MTSQKILLKIVKTWKINPKPEYRGFGCANCQKPIRKAWYHWLNQGGYKLPVHFCNRCEKKFRLNKIEVKKPVVKVNKSKFIKFPENIKTKLQKVVRKWNTKSEPIYKTFVCDNRGKKMFKAYHIWFILKETLIEVHFCKQCGDRMRLQNL